MFLVHAHYMQTGDTSLADEHFQQLVGLCLLSSGCTFRATDEVSGMAIEAAEGMIGWHWRRSGEMFRCSQVNQTLLPFVDPHSNLVNFTSSEVNARKVA